MASPSSASPLLGPDSHEEILLEFRVGKMIMEATTVKPDLRKGVFRLLRGDGFLRIQWRERSQEFPEDDILVFPHEANFVKVQQSSGRVYLLKFKQDERKYFFWMQEPNDKQDVGICQTVDFYLNYNMPDSDEEEEEPGNIADFVSGRPQKPELSKVDGEKDSAYLPGTQSKVEGAEDRALDLATAALQTMAATPQGAVQLEDLQRILRTITPLAGTSDSDAMLPQDTGPSLADVLKPELVVPLLEDSHLKERLTEFLPEGSWTPQAIGELMQSPQFHQQVDAFTHVLRSGQIDLTQFGIDASKYNFTVLSFLEAIEDQVAKRSAMNIASASASASEESEVHTSNDGHRSNKDHEGDHHMEEGAR